MLHILQGQHGYERGSSSHDLVVVLERLRRWIARTQAVLWLTGGLLLILIGLLNLVNAISGLLGITGLGVTIFALYLYMRDRSPRPLILFVLVRKMDPDLRKLTTTQARDVDNLPDSGDRIIIPSLSNVGGIQAERCSAGLYEGDNLIKQFEFVPVDSPAGIISPGWTTEREFTLYPHTQITVRTYLDSTFKGRKMIVKLLREGIEVHQRPVEIP